MIKKIFHYMIFSLMLCITLSGCDKHEMIQDYSTKVGHILCTDGKVVPLERCIDEGKTPIAVVFHLNQENPGEKGYAVYLKDISRVAFADSLGVKQNTSADIAAFDGNENTHAIYSTANMGSPLAECVFSIWEYGQSAYVPSVAQMTLLYHAKAVINPYLESIGGVPISDEPDRCWYWTSTEVKGQEAAKAWLYSLGSGARQETPKDESHKVRPIVTIY